MLEPADFRRHLRQDMLARRNAIPKDRHDALCAAVCAHLLATFSDLSGRVVGFCWPVQAECDVRPAIETWLSRGARAALPLVVDAGAPLAFREWAPESEMHLDRYGIPYPADGSALTPDILLLPVNAFDAAGYRLGYGGGYFDRTLAALDPRPFTVGVGFEINRVDSIRPEPHDLPLDCVVTEAGTWPRQTNL